MTVAVVGAGAAGLMAAIWAGWTRPGRELVVLDGARTLGAKILVAGGGRCNVTHDHVDASAYAGSSPRAIAKVLRRFDVERTVAFFRELGVELKREETGKLFPTTDRARTVLDALLGAARAAGADLRHPCRVDSVERAGDGFVLRGEGWEPLRADAVVLATGGQSLPKSGSDGHGFAIACALGHGLTPRFHPALVALTLDPASFVTRLSGLTLRTTVELRAGSGKRLVAFTDSTLCTHLGLSGPSVLDISRHYLEARALDPGSRLHVNWWPDETPEGLDGKLRDLRGETVLRLLARDLPRRLAEALVAEAGLDAAATGAALTRAARRTLVETVTAMPLPVTGDRGYTHAEATAGGVPLSEIHLATMESRVVPRLHLCGEMCDVDGRIGGYNFQWAWASGHVAGVSVGGSP